MNKIIWTDVAIADLKNIEAYISKDSNFYARAFLLTIFNSVEQLERFPKSGRIVPEFKKVNTRQLLVGAYRIIYDVTGSSVRILTVIHGARLLRKL